MAFLGSLGKIFGISTPEAAQIGASYATGGLGQAALTTLGALGDDAPMGRSTPVDVTAPPAGVDSPATVSQLSQTSQLPGPIGVPSREFRTGMGMPTQQAFLGGFGLPGLIGQAGRFLTKPGVGGALTGIGAGIGIDTFIDMLGNEKKLVITRKLQRDVKKVFMLSGGDLAFISDNSMMLFGKLLSQDQLLRILFKTFKNQGPYVTKAAVRKTRQTIRKMETLCDLKDRLCPPKPARRRAPARRMSTSITQVK
jgi:hypothetical protein